MGPDLKKQLYLIISIFMLAASIYGLYGFNGTLLRDDAIYIYSGQQMASGTLPYVSIFDHKGPLAPMLAGIGAIIAKAIGLDSIFVIRCLFFLLSCLTVVSVYLLTAALTLSRRSGFFAALTFLSFQGFAFNAASGPRAKTPMVLFETLCMYFTVKKRWFWAGFMGSLAFLVWQPCGIFAAVVFFLSLFQSEGKKYVTIARTLIGILLPLLFISINYGNAHSLNDLLTGLVFFNLQYLDRGESTLLMKILAPLSGAIDGYKFTIVPLYLGLFVVLRLVSKRISKYTSLRTFTDDPYSVILLTYPFPILWSLIDFQGYADFFVFLPYAALGFGQFIEHALRAILADIPHLNTLTKNITMITISIALFMVSIVIPLKSQNNDLVEQKAFASALVDRFGEQAKIASLGAPELLVLMGKTNPNRYLFIIYGIDRYINHEYENGFAGFVSELQKYNPDIIAFGETTGIYTPILFSWLESRYIPEDIGPFHIYVRK